MEFEKIGILGGGNLGISIAKGLIKKKFIKKENLKITKRNINNLEKKIINNLNITNNNIESVKKSQVIILCIQPQQLYELIDEIKPYITDKHIIISTMAGVTIENIQNKINKNITIFRAMPNTAIAIGESMTCICSNEKEKKHSDYIQHMFNQLGDTLLIDEKLMQAATVLGASGIAFFMRYIRASTQGGIQMGFHPHEAHTIAVQTAKGAASLLLENKQHPEVEIDRVTTPMGCTITGLNQMDHEGFSSALIKGLIASFNKIKALMK